LQEKARKAGGDDRGRGREVRGKRGGLRKSTKKKEGLEGKGYG